MALRDLKNRAKATRDLQEVRINRIREAVVDVVNSSSFVLTAVEHAKEDPNILAEQVATKVSQVVSDAKAEFLDTCLKRGLRNTDIRRAVRLVNETFGLTNSTDDEEITRVVAEFMQENPLMYDDIAALNGPADL